MSSVIDVAELTKHFGRTRALDGLNLSVEHGDVHGFLGPNGSGKSTTIRILLGLVRARSGTARVFERDPWKDSTTLHRRIAYVPGDVALWPNISGGETIDLLGKLRGDTRHKKFRRERARLLDVFQLDPTVRGRNYSKGNRQKVALVAAFSQPADLYIFDEPTSGLDPLMETVFNDEVARVAGDGATILLSSHILSEVERLCEKVTIVRQGRAVETGTLTDLRRLTRTEVSFAHENKPWELSAQIPAAQDIRADRGKIRFTVESSVVATILPTLSALRVQGLTITPPTLEELFMRHYDTASEATSKVS